MTTNISAGLVGFTDSDQLDSVLSLLRYNTFNVAVYIEGDLASGVADTLAGHGVYFESVPRLSNNLDEIIISDEKHLNWDNLPKNIPVYLAPSLLNACADFDFKNANI